MWVIQDRLALFGVEPEFKRIALNMDQIEQYDPPPNPTKLTDSRCNAYIEEFGTSKVSHTWPTTPTSASFHRAKSGRRAIAR